MKVYKATDKDMKCRGFQYELGKWYEHEDHMLQYSLRHPGVTFYLQGYGEEATDIWAKWFKSGESQEWRLDPDIPGIDDLPSPWPSETPGTSSAG